MYDRIALAMSGGSETAKIGSESYHPTALLPNMNDGLKTLDKFNPMCHGTRTRNRGQPPGRCRDSPPIMMRRPPVIGRIDRAGVRAGVIMPVTGADRSLCQHVSEIAHYRLDARDPRSEGFRNGQSTVGAMSPITVVKERVNDELQLLILLEFRYPVHQHLAVLKLYLLLSAQLVGRNKVALVQVPDADPPSVGDHQVTVAKPTPGYGLTETIKLPRPLIRGAGPKLDWTLYIWVM